MEKLNFVALDFETATNTKKRICQIGLVKVEDSCIVAEKCWLVKPPANRYDWQCIKVHHITPDMTADMPEFDQIWPEVFEFLNNEVVVAHKAQSVELAALTYALEEYGIDRNSVLWPQFDCYCSCTTAENSKRFPSNGLPELAEHYDIQFQHHDALEDAKATAILMFKMQEDGIYRTFSDLKCIPYNNDYHVGESHHGTSKTPKKFEPNKSRERLNRDEREKERQRKQCNQRVRSIQKPLEGTRPIIRLSNLEHNPFVGKRVCVTGDLIRLAIWREGPFSFKIPYSYNLSKSDVVEFLEKLQAEVQGNVRKDTDLLLVLAYRNYEDDHESTKHAKAKEYKNKGQEIQIMLLEEFMKLIDFV